MPPGEPPPGQSPASAGDVVVAGAVAAVVAGAPSTLIALARREDLLEPSLAAGTIALPRERRTGALLAAAAVVHGALSLWWAAVLAVSLPQRRPFGWATLAGLAIAGLDLGIIGRRFPRIRALPALPQVADHLAYAWTVAAVLSYRRRRAGGTRPPGAA